MQKWGWTPTSAPVAHDRLNFVPQIVINAESEP
jgi:hypothetical protein